MRQTNQSITSFLLFLLLDRYCKIQVGYQFHYPGFGLMMPRRPSKEQCCALLRTTKIKLIDIDNGCVTWCLAFLRALQQGVSKCI